MASLVLVCDSKKWFSTTDQILMGGGNAEPAYTKAREIQSYAYAVRWTSPAPSTDSALAKLMDADLQSVAAVVSKLESSSVSGISVSEIAQAITDLEKLCQSIVTNDGTWASSSARPSVVAQLRAAESKCGFWHPFACVEDLGGVILKWAAIGAVGYFGGKYLLGRLASSRLTPVKARRR